MPTFSLCDSYTSGNKCSTVIDNRYAPLNDKKSWIILVLGFKEITTRTPIKTDKIKAIKFILIEVLSD